MTNNVKVVALYNALAADATVTVEEMYDYYALAEQGTYTMETIGGMILGQSPLSAAFDVMTNEQIVDQMYLSLLGKGTGVDTEGKTYWVNELATNPAINLLTLATAIVNGADATDTAYIETQAADLAADLAAYEPTIIEPEGDAFYLTAGVDVITGTSGADAITADLNQVPYTGAVSNTLATGDRIDGGASTDTLTAQLSVQQVVYGEYVDVQPRTTSVEVVKIESQDFTSSTVASDGYAALDAKNMTGIDEIGSFYSDGDLLIENLTTLSDTGAIRSTAGMTITMDHTDSFDHDGDASDLHVYFDEDYLNVTTANEGSTLTINMINTLNLAVADGSSLIEGFETLTFSVGEDLITVDVAGAELTEVQGLIQAALLTAGYSDITVSTYTEPAYFGTNIYYENTATTYTAGTFAGNYTAFLLTNGGEEELTEGGFTFVDGQNDGSIAYSQDDSEATQVTAPISIKVELDKVGRDAEGGDLVIGAKGDDHENDTDVDTNDGINVFNITVNGDENRPSNLGIIASTNGALETVNIASETRTDGSYAALTVRDAFGGTLDVLNANAFLGDLYIGQETNAVNIDTFTATGGGNVTLLEDIGATDNGTDGSFASLQDNAYSVTTGAGADNLTIDANSGAQLTVVSGAGNDTIAVSIDGQDASGSDLTFANISSTGGNNVVTTTSGDSLHAATITLGDGADTVRGNSVNIDASTGAGNDVIYAENTGAKTVATYAAGTATALLATTTMSDNVVADVQLLYGQTVRVTLNGLDEAGLAANDFTDGFEVTADIVASNGYLTTELDLYTAIANAINTDTVLNKLAVASIDSLGNLTVQYLIDGSTTAGDAVVEWKVLDNDWTTGLSQVEKDGITNALRVAYSDSDIGVTVATDVSAAYDSTAVGTDTINVATVGTDSVTTANNVVNGGTGDDVIVLSSDIASAGTQTDTVVFDTTAIGNDTIVHFTDDATGDVLDFTAWLTNETDISAGPSGGVSDVRIATDLDAAIDFSANSVVVTDFTTLSALDGSATNTFASLTNAQILTALDADGTYSVDIYGGAGTYVGTTQNSILLIENNANLGEYIVAQVTSNNVTGNDSFTNVTIIGTVDFGETQTFNDANFA